MTEQQFDNWVNDETRAEWVNGEVTIISPVNAHHDDYQSWFVAVLRVFVEEHDLGRIFSSEFSIRLPSIPARHVPDVSFVRKDRLDLLTKTYFNGPPDLIIEVVSDDSTARDYRTKFSNYESAGVGEYWIVDPSARRFEVYRLQRKKFVAVAPEKGVVTSSAISKFWLRPDWLWQPKLPNVLTTLRELEK